MIGGNDELQLTNDQSPITSKQRAPFDYKRQQEN